MAESDEIRSLEKDAKLGRELVEILSHRCGERGESEGAVETLNRIIREGGGNTIIQKVEIVVTSDQSPSRIARLVHEALSKLADDRGGKDKP